MNRFVHLSVNRLLLSGLVIVLCGLGSWVKAESELPPQALLKALQGGGHILYMRHSLTEPMQRDAHPVNFDDCSEQRNLSQAGIELAQRIGQQLEQFNVPIGMVLSSPYCRCKDTAEIVFGDYVTIKDLQFSLSKDKDEVLYLGQRLKDMLLSAPDIEENIVYVGHSSNLREAFGIWPKPEGVIVVFARGADRLYFKGMIKPEDWSGF